MNEGLKLALAALTAGLTALALVWSDGITGEEWIGVILAVLAALGGTKAYTQRTRALKAEKRLKDIDING